MEIPFLSIINMTARIKILYRIFNIYWAETFLHRKETSEEVNNYRYIAEWIESWDLEAMTSYNREIGVRGPVSTTSIKYKVECDERNLPYIELGRWLCSHFQLETPLNFHKPITQKLYNAE